MTFSPGSCDRRLIRPSLIPSTYGPAPDPCCVFGEGQDGKRGDAVLRLPPQTARARRRRRKDRQEDHAPAPSHDARPLLATRGRAAWLVGPPSSAVTTSPALAKRSPGRGPDTAESWPPKVRPGPARGFARRRRLLQPFDRGLDRGIGHEGPRARDHLVEDDAQRVYIRGRRRRAALDLLRRHVGRGAGDLTLRRSERDMTLELSSSELRLARPKSVTTARTSSPVARLHEHNVQGLEIAVHDPDAVRGGEASRHLPEDERVGGGEPPVPPELVGKGLAVQQLHGEEHDVAGAVPCRRRRIGGGRRRRSGTRWGA